MKRLDTSKDTVLEMPCGNQLDLGRPRSSGILSDAELALCRSHNVPLAYDPVQTGWVSALCEDDIEGDVRKSQRARIARSQIARAPQVNALHPQYQLRAWEPSDLQTYMALLDDPRVWAHLPETYPDPLSPDMAEALIELSNASNHHQVFAVMRNSTIVGQVRLLYDVDDNDPGVAEISYWLGQGFWGKGIGTDIVALYTARCFADNGALTSIIARVHADNTASEKALTKAGYKAEGQDLKDATWTIYRARRG
ncbi:MAG: GNAT family N-acetyltransferase [Roseovarius sp.]